LKLSSKSAWTVGFLIITLFVILGELTVTVDNYVYFRLGLTRNFILLALWTLPCLASFIVAYYSDHKLWFSISLIPVLSLLGPTAHYINGLLGGVVDFTGMAGAFVVFKLYFSIGSILIAVGALLGTLMSRPNET
jgi:hypothetical protein